MSLRLIDLNPEFVRYEQRTGGHIYYVIVPAIDEAQGVEFLCPKCFAANGGPAGTHRVICWSRSRGVPDDAVPGPGRWTLNGSGFADLTLDGDPPGNSRSVLLTGGGCGWHGFITNGEMTSC
jgi:hypothetical protein